MIEEVQRKQSIASDPQYSIWTSASAGSGKTTVLVKRLLRMFLCGIEPSKILCITFTNTAAAEMRNRINSKLSEWATFDDDKLESEIFKLEGGNVDGMPKKLKIARSLFAKILDYSNDFKILTIHSFCQQVIKRFPLEANIIPNFKIADEILSTELLLQAKDEILKTDDKKISEAIKYVFTYKNEEDFLELLKQTIRQKDNLLYLKSKFFTVDGVIDEIRRVFNIKRGENIDEITKKFIDNIDLSLFTYDIIDTIKTIGKKTDLDFINSIMSVKKNVNDYINVFLTKDKTIRKKIITKSVSDKFPEIYAFTIAEASRVFEFKEKLSNIHNFEFTAAFLRITYHIFDIYAGLKRKGGYLDYSDLIFETSRLLNDSKYRNLGNENMYSNWINYKLDEGLDHLLIDEAQDTSPIQWDIVKSITEEFFAGYGQKDDENRTIFVVGDEKQSIFSFQGAEPLNFNIMLKYYMEKVKNAGKKFEKIYLETSFRSLKSILSITDAVFSEPSRLKAITKIESIIKHNVVRSDGIGKVEVWPLVEAKNVEKEDEKNNRIMDWKINYLENIELTNKQKLAEIIANRIDSWFKKGKLIYSRKDACLRQVKYSDIMILVKSRDKDFINYLIRQFNKHNIRTTGNDKFNLIDNIIAQDIISLFRFILFNEDDLSLANIVKSPFLSLNENDLYELCDFKNNNSCSLWKALKTIKRFSEKKLILEELLDKSKSMGIYEFMFYLFETKGFRLKFKERFPYITDEVVNEFFTIANNYETNHNNSTLLNFVYFLEDSGLEIKRDMEQSSDEIRIMTIHSSKGMESPIVILPDTNHATNTIYKIDKVLNLKDDSSDYTIPLLQKENSFFLDEVKDRMKFETEEEYLRLLYVAMTRAENELYICDYIKNNGSKENCWYEIIKQAVEKSGAKRKRDDDMDGDILYIGDDDIFDSNPVNCNKKNIECEPQNSYIIEDILDNISKNKEKKLESKIINPSTYYAESVLKNPHEGSINIENGKLVHKLLEILPDSPRDEWDDIIDIYLKNKNNTQEIKRVVLKILNDEKFNFLFSKDSKAEVPIFGNLDGDIISGRIDRLAIIDNTIYVVDYKNTNTLPDFPPKNYIKQLELYKKLLTKIYVGKNIKCFILWTAFGEIQEIL